ncbi:actin interacting protein 3-domain-containing protein [Mycena galericulata]|nr:actin interacting protein 3-domain-containing protein [Mycena galericulata]
MSNRTTLPSNPGNGGSTSSRRENNQSASSSHSGSGRSERGARSASHPAVESAVTRLLVAIKQLLEALTQWSLLKIDENNVSDVYVRLGNDFNAAVAAFAAFNIDMAELMTVPDDLRNVLEQCLAEDATPDNLELYLPTVRQIITNLLQGLRGKQSIYRRIVSDYRHRSEQSGSERTESRSSRSRREGSHRSQLSRTTFSDNDTPPTPTSNLRDRDSASSRKSTQQSSTRRKDPGSPSLNGSPLNGGEPFVGGFAPAIVEQSADPESNPQGEEDYSQQTDSQSRKARTVPPPIEPPPADNFQQQYPTNSPNEQTVMPPAAPNVPASVKRYSLVDKPLGTPAVIVEPSSPDPEPVNDPERLNGAISPPPPDTPPIDALQAPAMANSLAALKKSDTLERRASKRFSTYNISKMTGAPAMRERSTRTGLGAPNRRSLAASSALTPGDLAVLTEVDDEEPAAPLLRRGSSRSRSSPSTPERRQPSTPPVPPLPATPARTPEPIIPAPLASEEPVVATPPIEPPQDPSRFTVFLQLGREVKKVKIDHGLSFSSLRVLFVDKFSYNPGLENFPAIYIRDPSSGVQYELEDMEEVKEKCLLSLNIEPLDQIKQHIDAQISTLSQDIKELKTAVNSSNRQSIHVPPTIVGQPLAESTPAPNRPTDRQFQHVARRLSRFVGEGSSGMSSFTAPPMPALQAQMTGQSLQPQMTGGSMLSDYSSRVVTDLKTQFDEVQNLRRDLGIMRQLYTEFMKSTKESLGTLRGQTQSVKQLASTSVGGARGYIDTGKKKLDTRSQNVLTEVEKLQDTVEGVKDDVIKRHITPKVQYLRNIKKDIDSVAAEMESLKEHIDTIKPMWKKTWEEELQNIVDEQGFLTHQEQFLEDLLEDHKALLEVYGHVEKIISIRGPGSVGSRGGKKSFRPPPPEEGYGGLSTVMLEIRGAAVDPERRMKAIEASQKSREKELASRSDEMQAELTDFVAGKKLKMTGGAEEAERVRQKRNDMTLKAMFTGGGGVVNEMGMTGDSPG